MTEFGSRTGIFAVLLAGLLAGGCRARALVPTEADAYRDRIRALEERIIGLERANAELRGALASVERADGPDAEVLASMPRVVRLKTAWGGGIERDRADPGRGMLTVYLEPLDARDRFVPATGWLELAVFATPGFPAEPVRVGSLELGPAALRDRWRSGFLGTHYSIECPVDLDLSPSADSAIVQLLFRDGLTGDTLRANATVPIPAPATAETGKGVL
jgi:hypothetical protein